MEYYDYKFFGMKKLMLGLLFLLVAAGAGGQNVKKFTVLQWNVWQEGTGRL